MARRSMVVRYRSIKKIKASSLPLRSISIKCNASWLAAETFSRSRIYDCLPKRNAPLRFLQILQKVDGIGGNKPANGPARVHGHSDRPLRAKYKCCRLQVESL